jgi:PI-3-kinase-related kinase SMG-1
MGSAVGFIVGLGDRHLDNILLNPRYGHLVHVDFSILFGKGTSLKIPERVPFRLSQNLIAALQYPGVDASQN